MDQARFRQSFCTPTDDPPPPPPKRNEQELQTFLCLATYMGPFIPSLSTLTAPLRELVKQNSSFTWSATHEDVLDKIKESISDEITLTYFDPQKETVLQVDASSKGLGAVLLQDDKPVVFASKALNDVESRYANIEQEMLAWCMAAKDSIPFCLGDNSLS